MSEQRNGDPQPDGAATAATAGARAPSVDEVREALRAVIDPELGMPIVDLGLVYDIALEDGVAKVTFTLTSMGCPIGPMIEQQMQQILTAMPGIDHVEATMVFSPPWSPEKMTEEAKAALGMF